jgi:hypothetical protein
MNETLRRLPFGVLPACLSILMLASCGTVRPSTPFDPAKTPPAPDYSRLDNWAAHPDKADPADQTPCPDVPDLQKSAEIDVFFLHPTTYTGDTRDQRNWNADAGDAQTNQKTDEGSILFQASIFNGAGRVFAPRYRQAHLTVFYGKDSVSAKKALDVAYEDTKAAFRYYLEHWNGGRPFIIASHSQGARHALYLIRELVEGKALQQQFVAAYLVGWPVEKSFFREIKPCATPEQTGCYCSWRTWNRQFVLHKKYRDEAGIVCTNPLNWSIAEGAYAAKETNRGGVVRPFCAIRPAITDAEVHEGLLLSIKPKFPGSFLFRRKNYHIGDLNLFYMNVRENAQQRAQAFLRK